MIKRIADYLKNQNPIELGIDAGLYLFAFGLCTSVSLTEIGLGIAAFFYFIKKRTYNPLIIAKNAIGIPLAKPWLIYLFVAILACIPALDVKRSIGYLPSDIIKMATCIFLISVVTSERAKKIVVPYFIGAIFASLFGILSQVLISPDNRVDGFMNAVTFGEITAIALILGLIMMFRKFDLMKSFYVFVMSLGLILSNSRGALVGFLVALTAIIFLDRKIRKKVIYAIAILFLGLGLSSTLDSEIYLRIKSIPIAAIKAVAPHAFGDTTIDLASKYRLGEWKAGIDITKDFPWLGVGPSNVKRIFNFYYPHPIDGQYGWSNVHNLYLQQSAERGLIGLGALLLLLFSMLRLAWLNYRKCPNPYTIWAIAAMCGFLVMNITETSFQHSVVSMSMFLAFSCSYAFAKERIER
jgi:O-antigen ligase